MIHASSSKFPPTPDLDSFFNFTIDLPNDLSSVPLSYLPRNCPTCTSLLLQEEQFCPVCHPNRFLQVRDCTHFRFFQVEIPKPEPTKIPIVLFLLDLDLGLVDLLSFANEIIREANTSELSFFEGLYVNFVFLGSTLQLFQHDASGVHFYSLENIEQIIETAKPLKEFENSIVQVIHIAQSLLIPYASKRQQLEKLFTILRKPKCDLLITDFYYILSGEIPDGLVLETNTRTHIFNITKEPNLKNIEMALQLKTPYYSFTEAGNSMFWKLKQTIVPFAQVKPKISIITSSGAVFKQITGPIIKLSNVKNSIIIDIPYYSRSVPISATLKATKDYQSCSSFSMQIIMSVVSGSFFVLNEVWEKSENVEMWINSLDVNYLYGFYFRKQCYDYLCKLFPKTRPPWPICSTSYKFPSDATKFKAKLSYISDCIESLLFKKDILYDRVRKSVLMCIYFGDHSYLESFFRALISEDLTDSTIVFPPFIFKNSGIPTIPRNSTSLTRGLSLMMCEDKGFMKLKARIEKLRAQLDSC